MIKTYFDSPSQPRLQLPKGACDTHVHVFGPYGEFPHASGLKTIPAEAPKEALFALHKRMGIERCVIVQSVTHGLDNRVVEDAIDAGGGNYLGVALTPVDVSDAELKRLANKGFRGLRFHFMTHIASAYTPAQVMSLASRMAAHELHLQLHFESSLIHELIPAFANCPVKIVIDHMARVDAELGPEHEDFLALQRWLEKRNTHVKVSGIDRVQANVHGGYGKGITLARKLVETFPEQCVWGLDWPHPNHTHIPDDGELVDALAQIAPSAEMQKRLLVTNPQALYKFFPDTKSVPAASAAKVANRWEGIGDGAKDLSTNPKHLNGFGE